MVAKFPSNLRLVQAGLRNSMKAKSKKEQRQSKQRIVPDCSIPDSPQSAFIALFAPIRDESWPNVSCNYLFTDNGEKIETECTATSNGILESHRLWNRKSQSISVVRRSS